MQRYAEKIYRADQAHSDDSLRRRIQSIGQRALKQGKRLITTECWGLIDDKDGPLLDWGWVKERCALGVAAAAATGAWAGLATSNFCGPQFVGMWRDIAWHQQHTQRIKHATLRPLSS